MFRQSAQSYDFNIISLSYKGLTLKQTINIKENIQRYLVGQATMLRSQSPQENENSYMTSEMFEDIKDYWTHYVE